MVEILKEGTMPTATWHCHACDSELRASMAEKEGTVTEELEVATKGSINGGDLTKTATRLLLAYTCPFCGSNTFVPHSEFKAEAQSKPASGESAIYFRRDTTGSTKKINADSLRSAFSLYEQVLIREAGRELSTDDTEALFFGSLIAEFNQLIAEAKESIRKESLQKIAEDGETLD